MAFSNWTSDLKTRGAVGFLGKVINLCVQCKDNINTVHTTATANTANITAQNNATVKGPLAVTYENVTGNSAISTTAAYTTFYTTGASASESVPTLAVGTVDGQKKTLLYQMQNAAKTVKVDLGSNKLIGHNSSTGNLQYITFSDQAEWCELIWNATAGAWALGTFIGIATS